MAVVTEPAVVVRDLVKRYGGKPALRGVSLEAYPGETLGIVGPNGAGKTSLIECLEGLRTPDEGSVSIFGHGPEAGPMVYHSLFGPQLQESTLPGRLRVREALDLFAACYPDPWDIDEMLTRVGLADKRAAYFDSLSGGQKRRLMLALALIGRPPLLLLDEPTSGLDPQARIVVWNLLEQTTDGGTTIVVTTHDMVEAEERCDRVCIIDAGNIIASGTVPELLTEAGIASRVRAPLAAGLEDLLRAVPGHVADRRIEGALFAFGDAGFARRVAATLEALAEGGAVDGSFDDGRLSRTDAGHALARLSTHPARMEDLYLMRTGSVYGIDE